MNSIDNSFNMIVVSSLYYWHGYDRTIEGLKNYYKGTHSKKVNLYIVGTGPEFVKYEKLIKEYDLENHVFLTGYKSGSALD